MPHLQGLLVQQGVSFRNALASNPICAPSRASLLTGQQAHNHGVWRNARPARRHCVRRDASSRLWRYASSRRATGQRSSAST
jgi:arylsulfatase A-like enzyme